MSVHLKWGGGREERRWKKKKTKTKIETKGKENKNLEQTWRLPKDWAPLSGRICCSQRVVWRRVFQDRRRSVWGTLRSRRTWSSPEPRRSEFARSADWAYSWSKGNRRLVERSGGKVITAEGIPSRIESRTATSGIRYRSPAHRTIPLHLATVAQRRLPAKNDARTHCPCHLWKKKKDERVIILRQHDRFFFLIINDSTLCIFIFIMTRVIRSIFL